MADENLKEDVKEVLPKSRSRSNSYIVLREKTDDNKRKDRHSSYVAISIENKAFAESLDDLDTVCIADPSRKLYQAVAQRCYEDCRQSLIKGAKATEVDETDGSTLLHTLAHKSHKTDDQTLNIAFLLIEKGADVETTDKKRNTPLHIAAREGLRDLCGLFIRQAETSGKSLVNSVNENLMTPLHLASQEGQGGVVELLIQRGAKPNMKDIHGWFPIHYAVDKGCAKCCRMLAPYYQGDAALKKKQPPLLMVGAKKGYHNTCMELSAEKFAIDYRDDYQNTALHIAAKRGFYKFVAFLLELGASLDLPNHLGHTPLMAATAKDKINCVTMLVEKGASLTMKDLNGGSLLHIATSNKSNKSMEYLLKYSEVKKLINEKDNEGIPPIIVAYQKQTHKCITLLEEAGADPITTKKDNAIYYSKNYRGSVVIQDVLLRESNISVINEDRMTPLHIAAREGLIEACKSLLRKGARVNVSDCGGRTPLHLASLHGHDAIVKLLLKNGASKRAKDDKKFTALHWAAFSGNAECCQVLFSADKGLVREKNKKNKYALDVAFQQGRFEAFSLLLKKFSQMMIQIPEDLTERFHSYVHSMMTSKKRTLLEDVIKSNWWEVGFGATKNKMHGKEPCPLFKDLIKIFPDLASDLMSKCFTWGNYRLLDDSSWIQKPNKVSNISTDSQKRKQENQQQHVKKKPRTLIHQNLNWILDHPVYIMISVQSLILLQHSLTVTWVNKKWKGYAQWIFLFLVLVQLFSIGILVALLYTIKEAIGLKEDDEGDPEDHSITVSPIIKYFMLATFLLQIVVNVNNWCRLLLYTPLMVFVQLLISIFKMCTIVLAFKCTLTCDKKVYMVGIIALVLEGLHVIAYVDQLPSINLLANISRSYLYRYVKGVIFVCCITLLFAFIFHLLLWNDADGNFKTISESILSIALWQFGDFDQSVFFRNSPLREFSRFLFIVYLFTFGVLLLSIIKAPSITKEEALLNKEIGMMNLLFNIDVCFPMFRKGCNDEQLDDVKNQMMTRKRKNRDEIKESSGKQTNVSPPQGNKSCIT